MHSYLLLVCLLIPQANAASTTNSVHEVPEPPRSAWMQTDAGLQAPITLEAKGRPLAVVLSALSKNSGIDIDATRDIREYRVAIYANEQPLWKIMARLQDLFGHGKLPNKGYEWTRIAEGKKPPRYLLQRNALGRAEEAAQLDYPRTTAMRWLKHTRDYVRRDPKDRQKFVSDCPPLNYCAARSLPFANDTNLLSIQVLGSLSDAQLEAIIQKGEVDVPQYMLTDTSIDWLRQQFPPGRGALPGTDTTILPSGASLTIKEGGAQDSLQGIFHVSLVFKTGYPGFCPYDYAIDTLETLVIPEEQDSIKPDQGPGVKIDLIAHETVPIGKSPTMSLPVALSLLSREAKITIYAETFLKSRHMLRNTQGKPEYLLSRICGEFGYRWYKVGGDYVVYDKMWAQDRESDISQPLLNRWTLALQKKKGVFDPSDFTDIAHNLSDKQIKKMTFLFQRGGLQAGANLASLRLMSTLSTSDLEASFATGGILLTQLDEVQTRLVQQILKKNEFALPIRIGSERNLIPGLPAEAFDITVRDKSGAEGGGRIFLGQKTNEPILIEPR